MLYAAGSEQVIVAAACGRGEDWSGMMYDHEYCVKVESSGVARYLGEAGCGSTTDINLAWKGSLHAANGIAAARNDLYGLHGNHYTVEPVAGRWSGVMIDGKKKCAVCNEEFEPRCSKSKYCLTHYLEKVAWRRARALAYRKSEKHMALMRAYRKSEKGRASSRAYRESDKGREARRKYDVSEGRRAYERAYRRKKRLIANQVFLTMLVKELRHITMEMDNANANDSETA